MTDFGKFGLKACFGGWGFGEKYWKSWPWHGLANWRLSENSQNRWASPVSHFFMWQNDLWGHGYAPLYITVAWVVLSCIDHAVAIDSNCCDFTALVGMCSRVLPIWPSLDSSLDEWSDKDKRGHNLSCSVWKPSSVSDFFLWQKDVWGRGFALSYDNYDFCMICSELHWSCCSNLEPLLWYYGVGLSEISKGLAVTSWRAFSEAVLIKNNFSKRVC